MRRLRLGHRVGGADARRAPRLLGAVPQRARVAGADERASLANPIFEQIGTPGSGRHMAASSPVRAGGSAHAPTRFAPLLGADTDQVLHQVLGLDSGAIGRLHDAGAPHHDRSQLPAQTQTPLDKAG